MLDDLIAKVHMPGEHDLSSFRVEISKINSTPAPSHVVFMLVRIAEDLIKQCGIGSPERDSRETLLKIIGVESQISTTDYGVQSDNKTEWEFDDI